MRKKKHPEHANHERWLVSSADFITLLFAFFVVMFAASNSDQKKAGQIAHSVQVAFKETSAMVKDFHPTGSPQEIVAKQSEYAKKAFEVAMQNMRDLAELATKTTAEAAGIVRERIHDNLSVAGKRGLGA